MKDIQSEELLSEISIRGNYQKLRAKRIEYGDNTYIDIRIMQLIEDAKGQTEYVYTKKGIRILEEDWQKLLSQMHF